jgi:hypothetical protein
VAKIRKAGSGHQPDITATNHRNLCH